MLNRFYMLAVNHVTLATAAVLSASLYYNEVFFLPFLLLVIFASLLPDIDHPGSEVSKFFPLINKAFPHRGVTHSIFGVVTVGFVLKFLLGYSEILSVILIIATLIGVYFLGKISEKRTKQIASATGGFFSRTQINLILKLISGILFISTTSLLFLIWKERFRQEIIILLTLGFAAHLLGDFVTKDGIPLLWPFKNRLGLKIFRTGSWVESLIGMVLVFINLYLIHKFWIKFDLSGMAYWQNYLGFVIKS